MPITISLLTEMPNGLDTIQLPFRPRARVPLHLQSALHTIERFAGRVLYPRVAVTGHNREWLVALTLTITAQINGEHYASLS